MKTQEELAKLRNISSQKQSSLNALLSEKESLNSSINQYRSLNQTSTQEYNQNLQRLQDIEAKIADAKHIESNGEQSLIEQYQSLEFSKQSNVWSIREGHASISSLDSAEEVVNADVEKTEQVLQNPTTSILDDSQSLAALHVTSETSMLGDQDSDSAI